MILGNFYFKQYQQYADAPYKPNYTLRVSKFRLLKLKFSPAYACPLSGISLQGNLRDNRGVLMLRFQLPDYPEPHMFPGCSILGTSFRRFNLKAFPSLKSLFLKKDWRFPNKVSPGRLPMWHPGLGRSARPLAPPGRVLGQVHPSRTVL